MSRKYSGLHIADNPFIIDPHPKKSDLVSRRRVSATGIRGLFSLPSRKSSKQYASRELRLSALATGASFGPGHDCKRSGCEYVIINIAGLRFETQLKTLNRYPNTLLGDEARRLPYWDNIRQEYFFDRHRPSFDAILNYYQSGGRLHRPMDVPEDVFLDEIRFFELGDDVIERFKIKEGYMTEVRLPEPVGCYIYKRFFWRALSDWRSSALGRIVGAWNLLIIATSVALVCLETSPRLKVVECSKSAQQDNRERKDLDNMFLIETICVLWLIVEYGVRLWLCPKKTVFVFNKESMLDLIVLLPYPAITTEWILKRQCRIIPSALKILFRIMTLLRVMRILKATKYFKGLEILFMTIRNSVAELTLFVSFVMGLVFTYAAGIYFAQSAAVGDSHFKSIPEAFWWAVVTLTTVGYGDYFPTNLSGKTVGTLCVVSGILVLALPVPVIVAKFTSFYRHETGKVILR